MRTLASSCEEPTVSEGLEDVYEKLSRWLAQPATVPATRWPSRHALGCSLASRVSVGRRAPKNLPKS
jgi:hypothetical protein